MGQGVEYTGEELEETPLAEPEKGVYEPGSATEARGGSYAEGAVEFVVPGVDEDGIGFLFYHFAGEAQDGVGVDGGERDVDDLYFFPGVGAHQPVLEPAVEGAVVEVRIADGGRFTEDEDAKGAGLFCLVEEFPVAGSGQERVGKVL